MINKNIYIAVSLFTLMPFFSFGIFKTDTSPFPLLLVFLCLIYNYKTVFLNYKYVLPLFLPFLVVIFSHGLYENNVKDIIRTAYIYLTVPLVVAYLGLPSSRESYLNAVKLWFLIVAATILIQFAFGQESLSSIIVTRTSADRGLTSLFVEPSMFAISACMVYAIFMLLVERSNLKILTILYFIVFYVAQSATGILVFILMLVPFALYYPKGSRYRFVIYTALLLVIWLTLSICGILNNRASMLLNVLFSNPELLLSDRSIVERVTHIYLSITKYFHLNISEANDFSATINEFNQQGSRLYIHPTKKIMSGVGQAVFDTGPIFLLYLLTPFVVILKNRCNVVKELTLLGAVTIVYTNAISFAVPYFAVICGIIIWKCNEKPKKH